MPPKISDKVISEEILNELKQMNVNIVTLTNRLNEFHGFVREFTEDTDRRINDQVSQQIQSMCKNIETVFKRTAPTETLLTNSGNPQLSTDILVKSRIGYLWNKNLIQRKFAFWNMLKNSNKAEIYQKWLTSTPMVLPRKLQIKAIIEEPDQQRRLREKLSLDKMHNEIELLRLRGSANEQKLQDIDHEMNELITSKAEGGIREEVLKLWKQECEKEERASLQRWEKSDNWLSTYEEQFKNEYKTDNPFLKKVQKQKTYAEAADPQYNPQRRQNRRPSPIRQPQENGRNLGSTGNRQQQRGYRDNSGNRQPLNNRQTGYRRPFNYNQGPRTNPNYAPKNFDQRRNYNLPRETNPTINPQSQFNRDNWNTQTNTANRDHFLEIRRQQRDTGWSQAAKNRR